MEYTVPILLITFNRPDHVRKALTEIRKQRPSSLYIAQDGPRMHVPDDMAKIMEVRKVIEELVDWQCDLHTKFQEVNLGCGLGPFTAMSWFFAHVEYGIILEDDVLPHPLFFHFQQEMLERYKDDTRIGIVAGHNLERRYSLHNSYYFTFETEGTYGWGTWKRVWDGFSFDIQYDYETFDKAMKHFGMPLPFRKREHKAYYHWLNSDRHDYWDYQLEYYLRVNNYLNIKPNSCLTSHEGIESDATHTGFNQRKYFMEVNEPLFEHIQHPSFVKIDFSEKKWLYEKSFKILVKNMLKMK